MVSGKVIPTPNSSPRAESGIPLYKPRSVSSSPSPSASLSSFDGSSSTSTATFLIFSRPHCGSCSYPSSISFSNSSRGMIASSLCKQGHRVESGDTENRRQRRPIDRMRMVAFGQQIGCADVQKEAREQREQVTEGRLTDGKKKSGEHAHGGRNCVYQKPAKCLRSLFRVFEYHIHRINAVGKVVS